MNFRRVVGTSTFLLRGVLLLSVLSPSVALADEKSQQEELQDFIDIAQRNPLAQIAHAKTLAAQAREGEVAGSRWAKIDVTSFLAPSPKIVCDNVDCTQTSPRNVGVNIAGLFGGVDLRITQPLYTGGKLHYLRRAAESASKAHKALEEEVAGDIASKTAQAYFAYQLAQELVWMLEEGAEHIESGRKTLEAKLAEGADDASVQDRFRIQALQSEVGAQIADAKLAKSVALSALQALVGDNKATLENELLNPVEFDLKAHSTKKTAPQVRAAMHGVAAQRALETFEKRRFLPDFALIGGVNFARAQGVDDPPSAFARDPYNTNSAYVAVVAKWQLTPLAQRARVKRQNAVKREAQATLAAAKRLAHFTNSSAYARATQAQARLIALKDGARAGKAWVASILQADAIGGASAKDLADAYLAYFSARGHVLESIYTWNLAVFELRRRAGEFSHSL